MDVNVKQQWKTILFEWIKSSELIDAFGSIEHVRIEEFFKKFHYKLFGDVNRETRTISGFLKENFPEFEILYDETRNISPQDFIYIFSLFLYYSCVTKENEFFQKCCKNLSSFHQLAIVNFLEHFGNNPIFTKESLRSAIKEISKLKASNLSPRKSEQQSMSMTPNKEFVNQKLKELKQLKTQLDNEKFEKSIMEVDLQQSQEKIDHLIHTCKSLNQDIQSLKTEFSKEKEQEDSLSPNKTFHDHQLRNKMQKEIQLREDLIAELKYENEAVTETNKKYKARINVMEKQMREMNNKIRDLDSSIEELHCSVFMKDEKIQMLEEEKKDLLDFINESRCSCKDISVTSDMLDLSGSVYHTMNDSDFGENLAKSVIDVQLKEKDAELKKLKEFLANLSDEKNNLELKFSKLLKNFDEKSVEVEKIQDELSQKSKVNENSQNELKKLKKSLDVAQKKFKNENTARLSIEIVLEQERKSLKVLKDQMMENIEMLKNENGKLKENSSQIKSLENQLIRKEIEISELIGKFEEHLVISNDWKSENESLKIENQTLNNEIVSLKKITSELEKYKSQEDTWKKEQKSLKWEIEALKIEVENGKKEVREAMEVKLQNLKEKMKEMFTTTLENLTNKNKNLLAQIEEQKVQLKNYQNLESELDNCKKDNSFLLSKLRFSDKNFEMDGPTGSIGMRQKSESKIIEEKFDNAYLNDLKLGTAFDEVLKNENRELIAGNQFETQTSAASSKRKRRLSMSSFKNAFKFTSKKQSIFSNFTNKNNEKTTRTHHRKKLNRTLTPKNLKECDKKWTIEDDDDDEIQRTPSIKREIELDRKMKREMARDQNRPNLNDETVIETLPNTDIDEDSDWIEEGTFVISTPKCEKSMKHLRGFHSSSLKKSFSARSSDGLERYQSCRSLGGEISKNSFLTPTKSCTRNFIDTHIAVVNRMSDYTVKPIIRELKDDHYKNSEKSFWNNWKKTLPISTLAFGAVLTFYNNYF